MDDFDHELIETIPHLRAFARFMTRNTDQASDLVQEALMHALRARHQYQPGTNFKAWTFAILRNLYINHRRRGHERVEAIEHDRLEGLITAPNQYSRLQIEDVRRALGKLSPEHREVLLLVATNDFRCHEAAAICNCAVGTIKSRLSRARRELFCLLVGEDDDGTTGSGGRTSTVRPPRMSDAVAILLAA